MATDEEKRQHPEEPPNGGARAWMVALGAFAAQMCTFGYINTFGIFQSYYSTGFLADESSSAISWIGSLQAFFLFHLGAVSGPLSDRLGVKAVVIPSGATLVFSVMMTSLCREYYQFILAQGVLGGMACGIIFTPVISCVGQYFTTRRAWAMGVVVSGAAMGGIVFPITLNRLLNHHHLSFAGDKLGRFNITIFTYAACAILCWCWTAATSTAAITVWIAFFGFFSGFFSGSAFSLYSPTVAQVCPNPSDIGTYVGQGLAFCSLGALAGTPINGALIRNYGYLEASMFSGAAIMVGLTCQIIARLLIDKKPFVVV
ncbi:major facilitator superfamily domain-containing protein [Aspergillus cavernicola]|uniref:Major facilitator superfamily domain-containing protein n=1 Tax=Aspergillus cavernicola TaxID=176166 RepID=A0ABR4IAE8_9EURO